MFFVYFIEKGNNINISYETALGDKDIINGITA